MKEKVCKRCEKVIEKKHRIINNGYVVNQCIPCRKIAAKEYAAKKKELMKGSYWE
tara:strand:+ start:124 stop:288 length:165 start_codon:yes stop_codon:yes gene_type:complete